MSDVIFIKKEFGEMANRTGLMQDSISIFAKNFAGTLGRQLTKNDIDGILKLMDHELCKCNDLDCEWDQTS